MVEVDSKSNDDCSNGGHKNMKKKKINRHAVIGALIAVLVSVFQNPWRHSLNMYILHKTYLCSQSIDETRLGFMKMQMERDVPREESSVQANIWSSLVNFSFHISADYLLDETTKQWGQNLELMQDRVLKHSDHVENLYFTFLFVLKAVTKAEYDSGNHVEDMRAQFMIRQMVHDSKLEAACALPFNEAELWQGQGGPILRKQIQNQFRNISALMDCVGCEKCRLWGKLQVLGLGTALKILHSWTHLQLQRNEVIALANLLNRLSESLKFVSKMRSIESPAKEISLVHRQWGSLISHWWKNLLKSK